MGSFLVLLGSIAVTTYFAKMYESTELMLLVYLQAVLFVLSFCSLMYRRFTVKARVEIPVGIAEPEKESLVKLLFTNKGLCSVARVKVLLETEDLCNGAKKQSWMTVGQVPRGEQAFVRMLYFSDTGMYRIRLKKLRVYDVTGLFGIKFRVKSEGRVQVLPRLHEVFVKIGYGVMNFYGEADVYDEHRPGQDNNEIFQIREYRPGDRLQDIHWKLSAKREELVVKEHALAKSCPVVLFLAYYSQNRKAGLEPFIPFLEAAASLSFSLVEAACPHYVVWYSEAEQDIVRMRVDDEKSLFCFIGSLMQESRWDNRLSPEERYKDKYKTEQYLHGITLDEKLVLKKEGQVLAALSAKELGKSLSELELEL